MSGVVARCPDAKCPALRAELAKLDRFQIDAAAASAAYDPIDKRVPPPGFRNATDADLADMNLTREFIDNPTFAGRSEPSNFRAAVFVNETTGERLVAFKGTTMTSGEDWKNNAQQGLGQDSDYYTRAQLIANRVATSPQADNARYTGHSLGGGLASAAARSSGRPATTFNAAGLHPDTVKNGMSGQPIDAVYVRGEALTGVQQLGLKKAAADKSWPLDPPRGYGRWLLAGGALFGVKGLAAAAAARSVGLHLMGAVDQSLAQRKAAVQAEIDACC